MTELSGIPARDLDRFIENHLMVDTPFRTNVRAAIHIISSFLKEKCFQGAWTPVRVSKVVKVSGMATDPTPKSMPGSSKSVRTWGNGVSSPPASRSCREPS